MHSESNTRYNYTRYNFTRYDYTRYDYRRNDYTRYNQYVTRINTAVEQELEEKCTEAAKAACEVQQELDTSRGELEAGVIYRGNPTS